MSAACRSGSLLLLGLALAACSSRPPGEAPPAEGTPPGEPPAGPSAPTPPTAEPFPPSTIDWAAIPAAHVEEYLRKLSPILVGRVLSAPDRADIVVQGGNAIASKVAAWVAEPAFVEAGRRFVEDLLSVSGKLDTIDFGLPGNLAAFLVKNGRPWSEIITAKDCYDAALKPIKCDSGVPYGAGVLGTRAILLSRSGRFNLTRASTITRTFACKTYPLADELQPRVDKTWLIDMFQANNPEEQTVEEARNGFGNGFGCYGCHGQFSIHAQLFVRFDSSGIYRPNATGLQDTRPEAELGRSSMPGLMASHFRDPERAKVEGIEMYGKPAANLGEATRVLTAMPLFSECAAAKYLDHFLGVLSGQIKYDWRMFEEIGARARQKHADPTLADIVEALFTHPVVVRSLIASLVGGTGADTMGGTR
jgi:hypothetical protein